MSGAHETKTTAVPGSAREGQSEGDPRHQTAGCWCLGVEVYGWHGGVDGGLSWVKLEQRCSLEY